MMSVTIVESPKRGGGARLPLQPPCLGDFAFNAGAKSQPVPVVGGVHPGGNQSEIVRIFRASSVVKLDPISANQNKAWSGKLMPDLGYSGWVNAEQCRRVRLRENCFHGLSGPARAIRPLTFAERPGEITGATPQGAQRGKNGRKKPEHVHASAGVGLQASIRRGTISHDTR